MNRKTTISYIRIAGYHDDMASFVRLYVENRISKVAADKAYREGQEMKKNGVPCNCPNCQREQP